MFRLTLIPLLKNLKVYVSYLILTMRFISLGRRMKNILQQHRHFGSVVMIMGLFTKRPIKQNIVLAVNCKKQIQSLKMENALFITIENWN